MRTIVEVLQNLRCRGNKSGPARVVNPRRAVSGAGAIMRTAIRQSPQGRRGDYATESPFLANPPLADVGSMNPPHALAKSAPMILTEKFLLPPNIDDAQRQPRLHQRRRNSRHRNRTAI